MVHIYTCGKCNSDCFNIRVTGELRRLQVKCEQCGELYDMIPSNCGAKVIPHAWKMLPHFESNTTL